MSTTINPSNQTITQYNIQTGGASNLLNNVAPSATSGVPVISQGAASQPAFGTAAIAGGGTNATSMSTSTGIVKYDGTSLVTSSTALIDSSNRMTNTSQPCFVAYINNPTNVTGDGTAYTVAFSASFLNRGSNFNTSTFTFTAPVTGAYLFTAFVGYVLNASVPTSGTLVLVTTSASYTLHVFSNLVQAQATSTVGNSLIVAMTATDTAKIVLTMSGSTKVVDILGASGNLRSIFSGALIG